MLRCGFRFKTLRNIALILMSILSVLLFLQSLLGAALKSTESVRSGVVNPTRNTVAVYTGRSFHDEVTASMSCIFQSLNYRVVVYYDDALNILGYHPFAYIREATSRSYFGRCVDEWIPMSAVAKSLLHAYDVLVFITYPMKIGHHTLDDQAFRLLRVARTGTKVLLVTHHAKENFWKYMPNIEVFLDRKYVTFLFLAEHTFQTASEISQNHAKEHNNLAFIYPVVPTAMLFDTNNQISESKATLENDRSMLRFAVQGHFGGRHAKRRDVGATYDCLNALLQSPADRSQFEQRELELRLIGHMVGEMDYFAQSGKVVVRKMADLSAKLFYSAVAQSNFLLTSLGSEAYMHNQATSTVPTALMTNTPLVTTSAFLQLYPCLRDAPVHVRMNGRTECDSLRNAALLSAEEYRAAQAELAMCNQQLFESGQRTLQLLLDRKSGG